MCVGVKVWRALLKNMSIPVLLSFLGKMTADRMLDLGSPDTVPVCKRIWDVRALLNVIIYNYYLLYIIVFTSNKISRCFYKRINDKQL